MTVARPTIDWLLNRMTLAWFPLVNKPFMIAPDFHETWKVTMLYNRAFDCAQSKAFPT